MDTKTTAQGSGTIEPLDQSWLDQARAHLDSLTKPVGSLGRLEDIAAQVTAIQQSHRPSVQHKAVFIFAADHGVAAENVSPFPQAVTGQMLLNFLHGGAAVNALARTARAEVHVVDVGVDGDFTLAGPLSRKVRRGTRNFLREPAMSRDELEAAMDTGRQLAIEASSRGLQMVAPGEMGIGNTTAASAMTVALTGEPVERVTGRGTGATDNILERKKQVVRDSLALHFPNLSQRRPHPIDILQRVGGLEIAAMCGFILGAVQQRLVVVIDGFISTAAAAIACALEPATGGYLFAGHLSQEPGHRLLLDLIGLQPLLNLGMRLGEATGAVLAFPLIDAAVRTYNEMATFASAGVNNANSR